jgi:hypothetical protein
LQFHRDTQSISAYVLTSSGANVLFKSPLPNSPGPLIGNGPSSISGEGLSMADFVEVLSQRLGHPIIDQTGLTQTHTFNLNWKTDSSATAAPGNDAMPAISNPSPEVLANALETQLGLGLHLAQTPAEVFIVDRVQAPKDVLAARQPIPMTPQAFEAFVGHYQMPGTAIMTVTQENGHFWTQLPGQPQVEIFPEGPRDFFTTVVDAQISFSVNEQGKGTAMVLHQGGREIPASRMDDAAANQVLDALKTKIQQKAVTPGSEEALRKVVQGLANDPPNYDGMSPELAAAMKAILPEIQRGLKSIGALTALKFAGVDPQGADVYEANFEHGAVKYHVIMTPDGKIGGLNVEPLL